MMDFNFRKKMIQLLAQAVNSSAATHNFCLSSIAGVILLLFPRENIAGHEVPLFFEQHPQAFYVCVISVIFAFAGSFTVLMIGDNSSASRFSMIYSHLAMVLGLSSLAYVSLA